MPAPKNPVDMRFISPSLTAPFGVGRGVPPPLHPLIEGSISGPAIPENIDNLGYAEGLGKSFFHGLGPGLIGIEPSEELARFQAKNPIAAGAAEIVGSILPYSVPLLGVGRGAALGFRVAKTIPGLGRLARASETVQGPIKQTFLKEIATFAPLEATRVGLSAIVGGGEAAQDVGAEALFNLALFGTVGAGFKAIGQALPGLKPKLFEESLIQSKVPEFNLAGSPHEKLKQIVEIREKFPKLALEIGDTLNKVQTNLSERILQQHPIPNKQAFVTRLVGESRPVRSRRASRFFGRLGEVSPGLTIRKLVRGIEEEGGFASADELQRVLTTAKLDLKKDLHEMQIPRYIRTNSEAGRDALLGVRGRGGALRDSGFQPVSSEPLRNSAWITKEADGHFVVVRRIAPRPKRQKFGDEYLFFRTRDPFRFFPEYADGQAVSLLRNAYKMRELSQHILPENRTPISNAWERVNKAFPLGSDLTAIPKTTRLEVAARTLAKTYPRIDPGGARSEKLAGELKDATRRILQESKRFLATGLSKMSESPRGMNAWIRMHALFGFAAAKTRFELYGKEPIKVGTNIWKIVFTGGDRVGGIRAPIRKAFRTEGGEAQIDQVLAEELSTSQMRELGFNKEVVQLFDTLERLDLRLSNEIQATQRGYEGAVTFDPRPQHYMISRRWRGDNRVKVFVAGDSNRVVGFGSGNTAREAVEEADRIIATANANPAEPVKLARLADGEPDRVFTVGREQDLQLARTISLDDVGKGVYDRARKGLGEAVVPGRFAPRKGRIGFQRRLKEDELFKAIASNVVESNRYMADLVVKNGLREEFVTLANETPILSTSIQDSLRALTAVQGPLNQKINKAADELLSPVFGKNSATKIVRAVNQTMFTLTLGAGDLGFAALNALTPIQTVLPEISWIRGALPQDMQRYYGMNLVKAPDGTIHNIWSLEPLRLMRQGLGDLGRGEKGLMKDLIRAKNEGRIDAKLIEEVAGGSAEQVKKFKEVISGEEGVTKYLFSLSEWAPARTEEFSRALSFSIGRRVGQDFFKLEGDQLYGFAATFTDRTMFLYTASARPQIITGAVGTLFGLFKNWSMHYIANMMRYTDQAVSRGNFAPLAWMMTGTGAVAGVGALPGYGVANQFSKWASDRTLVENIYDAFGYGEDPGREVDAIFYGLPAFLGTSLQGRAAAPGSAMIRDVNMLFSVSSLERAVWLGDALGDAVTAWETTGNHPVDSQGVRDKFARAFLPRTLYRWMSFTEDRALKSLKTGNNLISDVSLSDRLKYTFGLTPLEFEKKFEASNILWERDQEMKEKVRDFGEALAEARLARDHKLATRITLQAFEEGVPIDSIYRSANSRIRNQTEEVMTRQFDEYPRIQVEKLLLGGRRK